MWKRRLKILGLIVFAIFAIGLLVGIILPLISLRSSRPIFFNTATFIKTIQGMNQLVTVKMVLEKVVVIEDPPKNIFGQFLTGESRVVLVAHGIAKAGVDLSKLRESDLELKGTNLVIRLPPCEITDVYLDEQKTQVLEHKTGFLRKFDSTLPQAARQQALDDIRRAARYGDIVAEADTKAREHLKHLFGSLGINVTIKNQ